MFIFHVFLIQNVNKNYWFPIKCWYEEQCGNNLHMFDCRATIYTIPDFYYVLYTLADYRYTTIHIHPIMDSAI